MQIKDRYSFTVVFFKWISSWSFIAQLREVDQAFDVLA